MGRCLQRGSDRAPHLESFYSYYVSLVVCVRIVAVVAIDHGGRVERRDGVGNERRERHERDRNDCADRRGAKRRRGGNGHEQQ